MSNNDIRAALEPCPLCGSEASLEDERLLWVVRCSGCGACVVGDRAPEPEQELPDSYWEPFRQSAVARWNRRPAVPPAPLEGEGPSLEEVEDLCEEHCFNVEGYESIECLQGLINDALTRWGRPAMATKVEGRNG